MTSTLPEAVREQIRIFVLRVRSTSMERDAVRFRSEEGMTEAIEAIVEAALQHAGRGVKMAHEYASAHAGQVEASTGDPADGGTA